MPRDLNISKLCSLFEDTASQKQYEYIFFADLCGSTAYKQSLYEEHRSYSFWLMRQLTFLNNSRNHLEANNGKIIKTLGDGILATFDFSIKAEQILSTSIELIGIFSELTAFVERDAIKIRIGLDYGETLNGAVVDAHYDPIGLCVDRCARLCSESPENGIAFSVEFNRRIKTDDKTSIHENIKSVNKIRRDLKGFGQISFYCVSL